MDLEQLKQWKTKLAVAAAILSLLVGIVTYTATATWMFADVVSDVKVMKNDIHNLSVAQDKGHDEDLREHDSFRDDIRDLRIQLAARRGP